MQKGTVVETHSTEAVHPLYRGRRGVVVGTGYNNCLEVQLEGGTTIINIDPSHVRIISTPEA